MEQVCEAKNLGGRSNPPLVARGLIKIKIKISISNKHNLIQSFNPLTPNDPIWEHADKFKYKISVVCYLVTVGSF